MFGQGKREQAKVVPESQGEIMGMDEYNKKYGLGSVDEYWTCQGEPTVEDWGPPIVYDDTAQYAKQRKAVEQDIQALLDSRLHD